MRVGAILLAGCLTVYFAGCRSSSTSNSAAVSGPGLTENPVGPLPGGVQDIHYSKNPYATDPVAQQDGRRLFLSYNCYGCHGGHGGGGMGPSLRDPVWIYGNRDDQIFDSIARGRGKGMPAWGSKLPQDQIWQLVAYIKTMGTPIEPEPPIEPAHEEVGNPEHNLKPSVGTQTPEAGGK